MSALPDLQYDEDALAICQAIQRFCEHSGIAPAHGLNSSPLSRDIWENLAQLGVFSAGAPGQPDAGGAVAACAICETLGEQLFPGPIAATFTALQLFCGSQASAILDGSHIVSLSSASSNVIPFAPQADIFLLCDGATIVHTEPEASIVDVQTLGGEIWGRGTLRPGVLLDNSERALLMGNIANAAYLAGAASTLLNATSEHAATRRQFGKALGDFQAVTHPLADCAISISAAQTMARAAASALDSSTFDGDSRPEGGEDEALQLALQRGAGAALSACDAALATAFACHQIFGASGVTLEGPVFHVSRRIRQVASQTTHKTRERELVLAGAGLGEI